MGNEEINNEINQRIDFVDLVKGICIILVVMSHVGGIFDKIDYHSMIDCFRLPLYFFISGIFFKSYEGFAGFLKRKVNKLFYSVYILLRCIFLIHVLAFKSSSKFFPIAGTI